MENVAVQIRTDEVAEERDLVGVYLHEISRTPLLDAAASRPHHISSPANQLR